MFGIPVEDLAFIACALGGGGLLVIAVVFGGDAAALNRFAIGGVSATPLLLAFISAFGAGGLFATHIPDAHGVQAVVAAAGAGVVGMGLAFLLYGLRRRAED